MKLHHIGIACKDIVKEIENIKKIHKVVEETDVIYDESQDAHLCFLNIEENVPIELISGPPVEGMIKNKISYCHICYEVDDLDSAIGHFEKNGSIIVADAKPAKLFKNMRVAFVYSPYGLVELLGE